MHRIGNYTAFFGANDVFSNWHRCSFEYRGHQFTSVEQFMMFAKARLFDDEESAAQVLATDDPRDQKAIGRKVAGFDNALWEAKRESVVYVGCREKFGQNPRLRSVLLASAPTVLVEASPWDRIWGVGLCERDPLIADPSRWRGRNLLGTTLMRVRDALA
ncbi:Riboflavin biosynthesis intermediates N-glycosidase [Paraburkholderia unamae]|uniref:NADAR family protein n=1 Tax=Paraburkholderia unamae TaxID=219649 RepID=UPI001CB02C83|nr:NADAR family protein [Paraburkholderia unamae]CAG9254905.1 Riboflavin biosynthesis intermediates N-glycosidase [Paraburkholderia unamae]